jgi:hypothetical protein
MGTFTYVFIMSGILTETQPFSEVKWLSCLPMDPIFVGSNQAEGSGFLRETKIHSTTSSIGEVMLLTSRKILRHIKDLYMV